MPHPKMLKCAVVLDKKEFEMAARKYLPKKSVKPQINVSSESDSDEGRLEIDETPVEPVSMPDLDTLAVVPAKTNKGVAIEWAPEYNPKYGSSSTIPKEKKQRARALRKEYISSGTQYSKTDVNRYCNDCIKGNITRTKLELELSKRGTSIAELTGGGPIGPDLVEKCRALVQDQQPQNVQVSNIQMKRAMPGLLPFPKFSPTFNNTSNNANVGQGYTEVDIRMSHIRYMPYNSNPDDYQHPFFNSNMTDNTITPSFEPLALEPPNFYGSHGSEPTSTNDELKLLNEEPTDDTGKLPDTEKTPQKESSAIEDPVDPFEIDESDKKNIDQRGEIEVFPDMSPTHEKTPTHGQDNEEEDVLDINMDTDLMEDFGEEEQKVDSKPTSKKGNLERQSILSYDDNDMPKKSRFSKIATEKEQSSYSARPNTPNKQETRTAPYQQKHRSRGGRNRSNRPNRPLPAPWASGQGTSKSTTSSRLFDEFAKICCNELYGRCNDSRTCNSNHSFPDPKWVTFMIGQMTWNDIEKFIQSCYKSIPCSIRYFHIFSSYFGRNKMKRQLIEAIPMAESHVLLLQNYKWIVDGLIHTGMAPAIAINTLLTNRSIFTPPSNKIVVEIIVKTNLERSFLENLVEISHASSEVYTVEMFHKFMKLAMRDSAQRDQWKILIENILQSLTDQDMTGMFDQQLIENFIDFLAKEEEELEFQN